MPLLAEAWSDARLNLDTLKGDTRRAEVELKKVVTRLQKQLNLRLTVDTGQAEADIKKVSAAITRLRTQARNPIRLRFDADVSGAAATAARAKEAAEQAAEGDIHVGVDVDPASAEQSAKRIKDNFGDITLDVDLGDDGLAAGLAKIKAEVDALTAGTLTVNVAVDDDEARTRLSALVAKLGALSVDLNANLDTREAVERFNALKAEFASIRDIDFGVDIVDAEAGIARLRANLRELTEGFKLIHFQADTEPARLDVTRLRELVDRLNGMDADIRANVTGDAEAEANLAALTAEVKALDGRVVDVKVDADGVTETRVNVERLSNVTLRNLERQLRELTGGFRDVKLDADPARANATLALLRAKLVKLQADTIHVPIEVDDGVAFAKLAALTAAMAALDGHDIDIDVDVNSSGATAGLSAVASAAASATKGVDGLSGISGTLGGAGMGGLIALASAFAAVIPGAIGAGVAFLGLGAGAVAAAGGFAALAVMMDDAAKAKIKNYFAVFKNGLVEAFAPVTELITNNVIPQFLASIQGLAERMAPLATQAIVPISDALLNLIDKLGPALEPLVGPVSDGLAALINQIAGFLPVLGPVAEQLTGPFFSGLLGLVDLLFGTAETATPVLAGALQGIGDLSRALIDPINTLVASMREVFAVGEGETNPLTDVLGQAGAIFMSFSQGVFEAVRLVADAVSSIGLENLANLVVLASGPFGGLILLITTLAGVIDAIKPAVEGLVPIFKRVGEIVGVAFKAALQFVKAFLGNVDWDGLRAGLEPVLDLLESFADMMLSIAPTLGAVFGKVAGSAQLLLPVLGAIAGFKLGQMFMGWAQSLARVSSEVAQFVGFMLAKLAQLAGFSGFSNLKANLESVGGSFTSIGQRAKGFADNIQRASNAATAATAAAAVKTNLSTGTQQQLPGLEKGAAGAAGAVGGLSAGLGALSGALAVAGAAIGAGLALYSQWKQQVNDVKQASEDLTQSLLNQKGAFSAISLSYREILSENDGFEAAFRKSGVSIAAVSKIAEQHVGDLDKLGQAWHDAEPIIHAAGLSVTGLDGGMPEFSNASVASIETFRENLDKVPASVRPIVDNLLRMYDAGKLTAGEFAENIEGMSELGNVADGAAESLKFNAGQLDELIPKAKRTAEVISLLKVAMDSGAGIQNQQNALNQLIKIYPKLAGQLGITSTLIDETAESANGLTQQWITGSQAAKQYGNALKAIKPGAQVAKEAIGKFQDELVTFNISTDGPKKAAAATKDAAETVRDAYSSLGSASLGSLFTLPESVVQDTESKAERLKNAIQENLDAGQLSAYIQGSERSVTRSLDRLMRALQQKAENISRLRLMEQLGYGDLAAQLATLNADPGVLGKFISQLFGAGPAEMAKQNARLKAASGAVVSQMNALGPAVAAGLGKDFGKETAKQIDSGTTSISGALDKMFEASRLRVTNLQRLSKLQDIGFGDLAALLADQLASDPAKLDAALDQLESGAAGGLAKVNARIAADVAASQAIMGSVGGKLGAALGTSVADGIVSDESKESVSTAISEFVDGVNKQVENLGYMVLIAKAGWTSLANFLNTKMKDMDPTEFGELLKQVFADGANSAARFDAILSTTVTTGSEKAKTLEAELKTALETPITPPTIDWQGWVTGQTNAAMDAGAGLWQWVTGQSDAAATAGAKASGDAAAKAASPGGGLWSQLESQIKDAMTSQVSEFKTAGEESGVAFSEGVRSGMADGTQSLVTGLGPALAPVFVALDKQQTDLTTRGIQAGKAYGGAIVSGTAFAVNAGLLDDSLAAFNFGVAVRLTEGAGSIADAYTALFAALFALKALDFRRVGEGVGSAFNAGLQAKIEEGFDRLVVPTVSPSVSAQSNLNGQSVGRAFADGVKLGLTLKLPEMTLAATLIATAVKNAMNAVLGINSPSTVGRDIGGYVGEGLALGLTGSRPGVSAAAAALGASVASDLTAQAGAVVVPAAQSIASAATDAVAASLQPSSLLGSGFGSAIAAGMLSSQGTVSAAAGSLASAAATGFGPSVQLPTPPVPPTTDPSASIAAAASERQALLAAAPQQQQPVAGTDPTVVPSLLTQILSAIRGIDATTDPAVIAMLQQLLGSVGTSELSPSDRVQMAAASKVLVGR